MRCKSSIKILFAAVISITSLTSAQEEVKSSFWGQAGTGVSFAKFSDSDAGVNLSVSLAYENQNDYFSLSYLSSNELSLFNNPKESVKSVELKYGRSLKFTRRGLIFPFPLLLFINKDFNYSFTFKAGVSYNEGLKRTSLVSSELFDTEFSSEYVKGFGVPVEIEFREEITDFIGLGISLYASFNSVKRYTGFNINIYAGQF